MSTDAIVLLKQDHKEVKALFREFRGRRRERHQAQGAISSRRSSSCSPCTPIIENECMYPARARALARPRRRHSGVLRGTPRRRRALHGALPHVDPRPSASTPRPPSSSRTSHTTSRRKKRIGSRRCAPGFRRTQLQDLGAEMLELKAKAPRSPAQPSALEEGRSTQSSVSPGRGRLGQAAVNPERPIDHNRR